MEQGINDPNIRHQIANSRPNYTFSPDRFNSQRKTEVDEGRRRKRCRTTTWRSRTWSGTRSCRRTRIRARAVTSSRLPRTSSASAKRSLAALAAPSTSPSSITSKIFLEIPIRKTRISTRRSNNPSPLLKEIRLPEL